MRFFCFHLMPWAHLPEDFAERYDSAWVTCPNTLPGPSLGGWLAAEWAVLHYLARLGP